MSRCVSPALRRSVRSRSVRSRSVRSLTAGIAAILLLAACGGDAAETAEALIEGQLAEEIGLGELNATCNQPADLTPGETFACTAITPDGKTIEFLGEMTTEDRLNVQSTNLLTESDVQAILPVIAAAVSDEVGTEVVADDLTCPSGGVILDDDGEFVCEILDRENGDVYAITIRTGGLEPGGGPKNLGFLIGDLIEP